MYSICGNRVHRFQRSPNSLQAARVSTVAVLLLLKMTEERSNHRSKQFGRGVLPYNRAKVRGLGAPALGHTLAILCLRQSGNSWSRSCLMLPSRSNSICPERRNVSLQRLLRRELLSLWPKRWFSAIRKKRIIRKKAKRSSRKISCADDVLKQLDNLRQKWHFLNDRKLRKYQL